MQFTTPKGTKTFDSEGFQDCGMRDFYYDRERDFSHKSVRMTVQNSKIVNPFPMKWNINLCSPYIYVEVRQSFLGTDQIEF